MIRLISILLVLLNASCATVVGEPVDAYERLVYRVSTGDRLRISVFDEPRLSGEFALDGSGAIAYPLLGTIAVTSKTTSEVRDMITQRLSAEFVRNPRVSVEIINYRPVYVVGEVVKSGEFDYVEGLTALALIAKAGGFTYRANKRVIYISRGEGEPEKAYAFDAKLPIRPGDTIRIGERRF